MRETTDPTFILKCLKIRKKDIKNKLVTRKQVHKCEKYKFYALCLILVYIRINKEVTKIRGTNWWVQNGCGKI